MQAKINSSIFYHSPCIHCGSWSPSQLPRGEGGVTRGRVASLSRRHIEKDNRWQSHLPTLLPTSPRCYSASSLGGGEPVENPCRHSGNMQTTHRARGLGMFMSCDWIRTWKISEPNPGAPNSDTSWSSAIDSGSKLVQQLHRHVRLFCPKKKSSRWCLAPCPQPVAPQCLTTWDHLVLDCTAYHVLHSHYQAFFFFFFHITSFTLLTSAPFPATTTGQQMCCGKV